MLNKTLIFKLAVLTLFATCSACSSGSTPEPGELVEVKPKSSTNVDLPEQELLTNAKSQYRNSLQSVARESFKSIKNNFPTGPYVEYSEIKIADTMFANAEYTEAVKAYEDYAKSRPTSAAVPYCLLRAGRSAELSSAGVGRDPNPFQRALAFYDDLLTRFPDSVYAAAARQRKAGVREILAEYDLKVISFYQQQDKDSIANQRAREFKQNYGTSAEEFEGSGYEKRSALSETVISSTKQKNAKDYLKSLPANEKTARTEPLSTENTYRPKLENGSVIVSSVTCDKEKQLAVFRLESAEEINLGILDAETKIAEIELKLENLTTSSGNNQAYSCFGNGDLVVEPSGTIRLMSESGKIASAFFARNPARIILSLSES